MNLNVGFTLLHCRYGYCYECINGLAPADDAHTACTLQPESFRGCPCSDAVGRQHEYQDVMNSASFLTCLSFPFSFLTFLFNLLSPLSACVPYARAVVS